MINNKLLKSTDITSNFGLSQSHMYALIQKGEFPKPIKLSEVTQNGWKDLRQLSKINAAIDVLMKHNYLIAEERTAKETGGKPSIRYRWNNTLEN